MLCADAINLKHRCYLSYANIAINTPSTSIDVEYSRFCSIMLSDNLFRKFVGQTIESTTIVALRTDEISQSRAGGGLRRTPFEGI